jgi:hypothetical protein
MRNTPDKPATPKEQRTAVRLLRKESVSIQIVRPTLEDDSLPEVVASETIDISGHGLRLLLAEPLEAERIFDICVKLKDEPKRFLLTGETRWCRYNDERQGHEVGIMILDGEQTDFADWMRFLGTETNQES